MSRRRSRSGKGGVRREQSVSEEEMEENWRAIFGTAEGTINRDDEEDDDGEG